jgi:hypothetical protein
MQVAVKRVGSYLGVLIAVVVPAALLSASASAEVASPASVQYCANTRVNNVQKCFGAPREMNEALGSGNETGICVGEDTVQGTCVPVGAIAIVQTSIGIHQPWVIGTASASTLTNVIAGVVE